VIKFMDVYQRSYCRPIETLVDIFQEYPDEIEYIFKPSCVPLMRCAGCCNDEALECVPTSESNITMQVGTCGTGDGAGAGGAGGQWYKEGH
jgi:neuropilin 2